MLFNFDMMPAISEKAFISNPPPAPAAVDGGLDEAPDGIAPDTVAMFSEEALTSKACVCGAESEDGAAFCLSEPVSEAAIP